ncbi:cyclic pyranopterin monophosphate synthase MoaC [Aeromicrobium sp. YIM 150415]|uniref:Cyclic pyranopterin monophosphate synthase n=1 Tax=Aeromicrobium piscarium TaxID=2590901 RepID=A0A554SGG9_9ACTN|nr:MULTISPECIES: cyclic pyranopterin monophosphate synthase MoaC [Aeromicrobium]MBM9462771.1 cyclic pyranopterin monophosphate synthase MoaC [Aeromicrobium sp. YIM 150415]TSD65438.1 cyclic pyranopterin monophosphate synthase MoaC [Aeromicrobium piscarium]
MEDRSALSHYRDDGSAHMVDVSAKESTTRTAVAEGRFVTRPDVVDQITDGRLPKGEALATARIAGVLAAKQTPTLIPLCHPLPLSKIEIDLLPETDTVVIRATVRTTAPTGVEMEAMTAVSVAGLTLYDMVKAVDRAASIEGIRVISKQGGTHDWEAGDA